MGQPKIRAIAWAHASTIALIAPTGQTATAQMVGGGAQRSLPERLLVGASGELPDATSDIVVTGSRVTRDGFRSPPPLTVLGAGQMSLTAPANIADAINQLPALATGLNPRTGNVNTGLGVAGLNLLNLRKFGSTRTPVLVNSRRAAPSKSSGLVDVSTIPQQLVRRVQVVTGGASAAYGSDAVTEVVNFIHTPMQRWKLQGQSAL